MELGDRSLNEIDPDPFPFQETRQFKLKPTDGELAQSHVFARGSTRVNECVDFNAPPGHFGQNCQEPRHCVTVVGCGSFTAREFDTVAKVGALKFFHADKCTTEHRNVNSYS